MAGSKDEYRKFLHWIQVPDSIENRVADPSGDFPVPTFEHTADPDSAVEKKWIRIRPTTKPDPEVPLKAAFLHYQYSKSGSEWNDRLK